jgi:hypothetical protein
MLDKALMRSVAAQMMERTSVEVDGKVLRVTRTGSQRWSTGRGDFVIDGAAGRSELVQLMVVRSWHAALNL